MECGICATRAHSSRGRSRGMGRGMGRGRGHTSITLCPRYTQPVRIISIHNYDGGGNVPRASFACVLEEGGATWVHLVQLALNS